ncbi:MAG: acyl carrier protein [Crocosphaera sp.]|nr:acyl carrier protein [Crocosphaera sp.]
MDTQKILITYITEDLLNRRLEIKADDDLLGDNLLDSMGIMWLIAFIEEKFDIKIPLEDVTIYNFRTVQTIDAYINKMQVNCEQKI